jgi:hypothetical protein
MACPSGCLNGGGQLRALDAADTQLLDRVAARHGERVADADADEDNVVVRLARYGRSALQSSGGSARGDAAARLWLQWHVNDSNADAMHEDARQAPLRTTYENRNASMINPLAIKW